jgi:hypothetical protein
LLGEVDRIANHRDGSQAQTRRSRECRTERNRACRSCETGAETREFQVRTVPRHAGITLREPWPFTVTQTSLRTKGSHGDAIFICEFPPSNVFFSQARLVGAFRRRRHRRANRLLESAYERPIAVRRSLGRERNICASFEGGHFTGGQPFRPDGLFDPAPPSEAASGGSPGHRHDRYELTENGRSDEGPDFRSMNRTTRPRSVRLVSRVRSSRERCSVDG